MLNLLLKILSKLFVKNQFDFPKIETKSNENILLGRSSADLTEVVGIPDTVHLEQGNLDPAQELAIRQQYVRIANLYEDNINDLELPGTIEVKKSSINASNNHEMLLTPEAANDKGTVVEEIVHFIALNKAEENVTPNKDVYQNKGEDDLTTGDKFIQDIVGYHHVEILTQANYEVLGLWHKNTLNKEISAAYEAIAIMDELGMKDEKDKYIGQLKVTKDIARLSNKSNEHFDPSSAAKREIANSIYATRADIVLKILEINPNPKLGQMLFKTPQENQQFIEQTLGKAFADELVTNSVVRLDTAITIYNNALQAHIAANNANYLQQYAADNENNAFYTNLNADRGETDNQPLSTQHQTTTTTNSVPNSISSKLKPLPSWGSRQIGKIRTAESTTLSEPNPIVNSQPNTNNGVRPQSQTPEQSPGTNLPEERIPIRISDTAENRKFRTGIDPNNQMYSAEALSDILGVDRSRIGHHLVRNVFDNSARERELIVKAEMQKFLTEVKEQFKNSPEYDKGWGTMGELTLQLTYPENFEKNWNSLNRGLIKNLLINIQTALINYEKSGKTERHVQNSTTNVPSSIQKKTENPINNAELKKAKPLEKASSEIHKAQKVPGFNFDGMPKNGFPYTKEDIQDIYRTLRSRYYQMHPDMDKNIIPKELKVTFKDGEGTSAGQNGINIEKYWLSDSYGLIAILEEMNHFIRYFTADVSGDNFHEQLVAGMCEQRGMKLEYSIHQVELQEQIIKYLMDHPDDKELIEEVKWLVNRSYTEECVVKYEMLAQLQQMGRNEVYDFEFVLNGNQHDHYSDLLSSDKTTLKDKVKSMNYARVKMVDALKGKQLEIGHVLYLYSEDAVSYIDGVIGNEILRNQKIANNKLIEDIINQKGNNPTSERSPTSSNQ